MKKTINVYNVKEFTKDDVLNTFRQKYYDEEKRVKDAYNTWYKSKIVFKTVAFIVCYLMIALSFVSLFVFSDSLRYIMCVVFLVLACIALLSEATTKVNYNVKSDYENFYKKYTSPDNYVISNYADYLSYVDSPVLYEEMIVSDSLVFINAHINCNGYVIKSLFKCTPYIRCDITVPEIDILNGEVHLPYEDYTDEVGSIIQGVYVLKDRAIALKD